jgi:predicted phosphodiesterase
MRAHFGGSVDILVMGHSHLEGVTRFGRTLVINPGSATLPRNLVDVPGTVGILEISSAGEIATRIISLA